METSGHAYHAALFETSQQFNNTVEHSESLATKLEINFAYLAITEDAGGNVVQATADINGTHKGYVSRSRCRAVLRQIYRSLGKNAADAPTQLPRFINIHDWMAIFQALPLENADLKRALDLIQLSASLAHGAGARWGRTDHTNSQHTLEGMTRQEHQEKTRNSPSSSSTIARTTVPSKARTTSPSKASSSVASRGGGLLRSQTWSAHGTSRMDLITSTPSVEPMLPSYTPRYRDLHSKPLLLIFSFLEVRELNVVAWVCRRWKEYRIRLLLQDNLDSDDSDDEDEQLGPRVSVMEEEDEEDDDSEDEEESKQQKERERRSQGVARTIVVDIGTHQVKAGFASHGWPSVFLTPGQGSVTVEDRTTRKSCGKCGVLAHAAARFCGNCGGNLSARCASCGEEMKPGLSFCQQCGHKASDMLVVQAWAMTEEDWQVMELTLAQVLRELGVKAGSTKHRMIIACPIATPNCFTSRLKKLMLGDSFRLRAISTPLQPALALHACGLTTGLVVDIGHSSTQVAVIVHGHLITGTGFRVAHLCGVSVNTVLRKLLEPKAKKLLMLPTSQEFLSLVALVQETLLTTAPNFDAAVRNPARFSRKVPGKNLFLDMELVTAPELFFNPKRVLEDEENSFSSLQDLVAKAIEACDVHDRVEVASHIVLCGGCAQISGLDARLQREMKKKLPHLKNTVEVLNLGPERDKLVWRGAQFAVRQHSGFGLPTSASFAPHMATGKTFEETDTLISSPSILMNSPSTLVASPSMQLGGMALPAKIDLCWTDALSDMSQGKPKKSFLANGGGGSAGR